MQNPKQHDSLASRTTQTTIGVVLAGGISRRMGRDKASLHLPDDFLRWWRTVEPQAVVPDPRPRSGAAATTGPTLLDWARWRLRGVCERVLVAGGPDQSCSRSDYEVVPDAPGGGPVAGILGAADAVPGRSLLVLACDVPLLRTRTLHELRRRAEEEIPERADALIAWGRDRWQPLVGVYSPTALAELRRRAESGELALYQAIRAGCFRTRRFDLDDCSALDELLNLNRPRDLERLVEMIHGATGQLLV